MTSDKSDNTITVLQEIRDQLIAFRKNFKALSVSDYGNVFSSKRLIGELVQVKVTSGWIWNARLLDVAAGFLHLRDYNECELWISLECVESILVKHLTYSPSKYIEENERE